ncbi:sensor histidine kinase [Gorillibacterium sp. CAU 1737]|uniref:HAMP domain-containing sensor histidine kinase n=1 Tax=Gorillibacterium sp. CAU 1737 TaxID=3140362 RepID=UPI0032609FB9
MNKRLTGMVWRSLAESVLIGFLLSGVVFYFLYTSGYILAGSWEKGLRVAVTIIGTVFLITLSYGYWSGARTARRIDQLSEVMLSLEKGNLSRSVPPLGEDEIGGLGEQLNRIGKKWEEQVSSLQRLSNNNAQLAEKARYSAIMEERQRLARDLHDAVSQQLFAISMTATAVGRIIDRDIDKATRQIHLIEEMASVAQSEMRALLLHLRPVHLEGKRLAQGLRDLINELQAKVQVQITLEMDEELQLQKGIEDHLFRIVQETLSNALRHSKASHLEIRLAATDSVRLVVRDNGVGFKLDEVKHASYGLVSIRERVSELGGSLHIVTAPDRGTRLDIRIPLTLETKEEDSVGQL